MNVTRLGLGTNFKKQHNLGGQLHIAERTAPEAISAATLESETGIDRYTLARGFRARFGSSPHRYPIGRRLERVKAEIARLASRRIRLRRRLRRFADERHMTRYFKARFGLTPSRYLALVRVRARVKR
jgi:AraC-like DNA-binding protein